MKSLRPVLYTFLCLLFFSCHEEMNDELSLEESLEMLIIGQWSITDFTSENATLSDNTLENKSAIAVKNTGSDYDLVLDFKENPKQLIATGDFSITMTGTEENQPFSNTYKCSDFLDKLLLGDWGILNSNLYLSKEELHATILIQELTTETLKLSVNVDQDIEQEGKLVHLNTVFCLTFTRKL